MNVLKKGSVKIVFVTNTNAPSLWNKVLGPFYSEEGLRRRGIEGVEGLIGLHTFDGVTVYPHAQFDLLPNQTLRRREAVLGLWNTRIQPAIDEGMVDEWTATGLLLQHTEKHPSKAEIIANDETQVERVAEAIAQTLSHLRH